MRIKIPYLITVIISILLLYIGHRIVSFDLNLFQNFTQEHARATVQSVIGRELQGEDLEPFDEFDDFFSAMMGEVIVFEAEIRSGIRKGETVVAEQNISSFLLSPQREVRNGDSVLLISFGETWFFNGYIRTNQLLVLGSIFTICIIIFGGKKGFNTLLSLSLTCAAIFLVFIPSILSGFNIYLMAGLVCIYTVIMTLLIVIGLHEKALAACIGCISGIVITGLVAVIMNYSLHLTGIVDEHSRFLANLPLANPINLRAIIFAGIIIGATGAIMDVAMSISSALWELKEKGGVISVDTLFRSGINIGRDILGSMANTLILAYIGSALSVVLIISVYSNSLMELLNTEMIVVEILQALAGIFGILLAMPLTAFFCALLYTKKTL
ncbi:MAG: YibE/F family protein [Treponema sp.]|nr:YibE/F family protein [Treponema sp.]